MRMRRRAVVAHVHEFLSDETGDRRQFDDRTAARLCISGIAYFIPRKVPRTLIAISLSKYSVLIGRAPRP